MRFSLAAFLAQMPHLDAAEEAKNLKGTPLTKEDAEDMNERILYAKKWIEGYAPPKYVFELTSDTSGAPAPLEPEQVKGIQALLTKLEALPATDWTGEKIHEAIHLVKQEMSLEPKILFEPFYKLFLNRSDGPQAGWFLSTLNRDNVLARLKSVLS